MPPLDPEPAAQNPEQNRTVQESEKPWAPLLQDISALSNIEEQDQKSEPRFTDKNKTRLDPKTDSDLQPQTMTPTKKNTRPMKPIV